MPEFRIGFGSDFVLKNQSVGIGTENPRATLDVVGTLKGDLLVSGVTTLTSYAGFVPQRQLGDDDTITNEVNTISEDIIVSVGKTFTVSAGAIANIGTLEQVTIGSHFSPPNGGISLRPEEPIEGTVRFNDDLNTLEFYNGVEWRQFTITGASGRAVFAGGPSSIEFINMSTTGNALDFGRLSVLSVNVGSCASPTRGIFAGGYVPTVTNIIEYITIASESNSIDFGDLTIPKWNPATASSSTRGVFMGGFPRTNVIDYIEISTIGNALDFGDLFTGRYGATAFASPVRAVEAGEDPPGTNIIDFITIASKGNSVQFGVLTERRRYPQGCSNSTRGLFAGGRAPTLVNTIDYVTIATQGDAIDFGDLTVAREYAHNGAASQVRGIFAGGIGLNTIDYVIIASSGNAQDFGDLTVGRSGNAGCSDSHGGLGGF